MLRLKNGEDFAQLAKAFSIDPSASHGGYMEPIDPLTLRAEVRDALRSTAAGQITGVIHTQSGYAILKVVSPAESGALRNTAPARILPSSATGAIRYTPNVGGKGEVDLAFRSFPKPDGWNQDLHQMCEIRQKSIASVIETVLKQLDPTNPEGVTKGPALDRIQMHYTLANIYSYQGEMDKAIDQWLIAYNIAGKELAAAMPDLEDLSRRK